MLRSVLRLYHLPRSLVVVSIAMGKRTRRTERIAGRTRGNCGRTARRIAGANCGVNCGEMRGEMRGRTVGRILPALRPVIFRYNWEKLDGEVPRLLAYESS